MAKVIAAVPFLGVGPVGVIFGWAFNKIANKIYEVLELEIAVRLIHLKNDALRKKYDKSYVALREIAGRYGENSEQFRKSRDLARSSLAALVRHNFKSVVEAA